MSEPVARSCPSGENSSTSGAPSHSLCFVATAAWGSPLEREVGRLRAFRDQRLLPSAFGQLFVAGYYAFGPSLAQVIAPDPRLRALSRRALAPLVALVGELTAGH